MPYEWEDWASIIACYRRRPRLYDAGLLKSMDIPCAAILYADDSYVLRRFSEETADLLPGMHRWLTDEYLHNGVRFSVASYEHRRPGS